MTLNQHLAAAEKLYLCDMLVLSKGCVAAAARLAKVSRVQFHRLCRRHDITTDDFRPGKEVRYPTPAVMRNVKGLSGRPAQRARSH